MPSHGFISAELEGFFPMSGDERIVIGSVRSPASV
jgi:hypothetical protein